MEYSNQKIISTRLGTNYSFIMQEGKFLGLLVENSEGSVLYSFYTETESPKVSNEVLEDALKALLRSNTSGFDILLACFYGLKEQEEYFAIAKKVFKDYWKELENLAFFDMFFDGKCSLKDLDEMQKK